MLTRKTRGSAGTPKRGRNREEIVDRLELRFGRDQLGGLICGYGDVEEREEKTKVGLLASMVAGWWRCTAAELG